MSSISKQKASNLDRPLGRGKPEVNVATFALLFSEIVQYSQNRVYSVSELQTNIKIKTSWERELRPGLHFDMLLHNYDKVKLSDIGQHVGSHLLDLLFVRDKGYKREIKLLQMLLFIKNNFWKTLFGKEADRLEHSNDDERTYYIIESEHLVNRFISVPKDKGKLNCAAYTAGIIEAVLNGANFPAKVTAHWHKGTTFMIEFDESVIARDKVVEGK